MGKEKLQIKFYNFGIKNYKDSPMPPADLYLDCRSIEDPSWKGATKTGDSEELQEEVKKTSAPALMAMMHLIQETIPLLPRRRSGDKDPYATPLVVACFCAHGVHRSRATKWILAEYLRKGGYDVYVTDKIPLTGK